MVQQKWVDIGSKRKDGSFAKCGRSNKKRTRRGSIPSVSHLAKARRMSEGQRKSAGCKETGRLPMWDLNPQTLQLFAKRKKAATGGYFGPSISGEYGGVNLSNSSSKKYLR